VAQLWQDVHRLIGSRAHLTSAYHPQTDGQSERMNRVLEEFLRHYVSPQQGDWDELLAMAEFAVNNSWNASTGQTPFYLNYGQHPLTPVSARVESNVPAAREFTERIEQAVSSAKTRLTAAQQRYKSYADKRRRELEFAVGSRVLLNTKYLKVPSPGTRKLLPRYAGPFPVLERIGAVAYRLQLPRRWRLHPVFHVSLLKPYHDDGRAGRPPPPLDQDEVGPLYRVSALLSHREVRRGSRKTRTGRAPIVIREYLVDWEGFPPESREWIPERNVTSDLLLSYWHGKPDAPAKYRS
jgi:hypothetical protein